MADKADQVEQETSATFSSEDELIDKLMSKLLPQLEKSINKTVNSAITARKKEFEPRAEETQETATKSKKSQDPQLAEALKKIEALEAKAAAEQAEKKDMFLKSNLSDLLDKMGIIPELKSGKMSEIILNKLAGYSEEEGSDELVWNTKLGPKTLESGVREHFSTPEGKAYLAPKSVKGSGDKSYTKTLTTTEDDPSMAAAKSLLAPYLNRPGF